MPDEHKPEDYLPPGTIQEPSVPKKPGKALFIGVGLFALLVFLVIFGHILSSLGSSNATAQKVDQPPTTMGADETAGFANQQAAEGKRLTDEDIDKAQREADAKRMEKGQNLESGEAVGLPPETEAQRRAEAGTSTRGTVGVSEADKRRAELAKRRQASLDSSTVTIDFSDYFSKDKKAVPAEKAEETVAESHTSTATPPSTEESSAAASIKTEEAKSALKEPHDPALDYPFDRSTGPLHRLFETTIIETVLTNRITGALVGPIKCMVTTDVYDESNQHLLIPQGTRISGHVSAVGSTDQQRLVVAFHRMIMPSGYSVPLDQFKGLDVVGQVGLRDLVNHHYTQIFGASLALAAISATAQIGNSQAGFGYDPSVQLRAGMSESMAQSANTILERFINILPTFTVRERARVKIYLAGDLLLPEYDPHAMDPNL